MVLRLARILLVTLLSTLCGCATTTRLTGTWTNPAYRGQHFHRILVLGVCKDETYQRIFEDSMCRELEKRGVQAEPGYSLFPTGKCPDKEAISKEIAGHGFDAMIISQMIGKRTEVVVHPGNTYILGPAYYRDWYNYLSRSYRVFQEPGYVSTYKFVTVQSKLYDTATNALVWSVTSETTLEGKAEDLIKTLASTLIDAMASKGPI